MLKQSWKSPQHPAIRKDLIASMNNIRREFNELFANTSWPFGGPEMLETSSSYFPTTDIWETEKGYEVEMEVPGLNEKDISVSLEDNILVISGEKKSETKRAEKGFIQQECSYGEFYRALPLTKDVDPDHIDAKLKNGILTVTLQKLPSEKQHVKKINVHAA